MDPRTLKNILGRGAGGNSSALVPFSGSKKDDDLVSEDIDEKILRLLGLDDIFDIDYGTYKTLLKEKLATARMTGSKIPVEEDKILRNEFKRIKNKEGRFKVNKKKIQPQGIFPTRSGSISLYRNTSVLSKETRQESLNVGEHLKSINESLDKILKSIVEQGKEDRKRKEGDRIAGERKKSQERESGLEKPLQVAKNLVNKIISPFRGILDRVFRFLGFTFLGWLIGKFDEIQKWLNVNKDKVNVIKRFLKDWWPSIAFAAFLFLTPFGKFVRTTIKGIRYFIPKIIKLLALIKANPVVAGAIASGIGAAVLEQQISSRREDANKLKPEDVVTPKETAKTGKGPGPMQLYEEQTQRGLGSLFAKGGKIPLLGFANGSSIGDYFSGYVDKNVGATVSGFGQDTQAFPIEGGGTAILKPGEVVMNTGAVNALGADKLLSWNKQFGGPSANKPINFTYKNGGIVGMQGGGILGSLGRFLPGTGTVMAPQSGGPMDLQGIRQTMAGYQNKFLGMNVGNPFFPRGNMGQYSQQENRRYYERTGKYFIPTQYPGAMGIHGLYTPPRKQSATSTSSSNQRLNSAIQNARDITNIPGGAAYRPLIESTASTALKMQQRNDALRNAMRKTRMRGAEESMNIYGKPFRRQSGGLIPQGPFTPLPHSGYVRPQGSFIPKPILALPGPRPGTTVPFGYDPSKGLMGMRNGGMIKENTGFNVKGTTADRQLLPPTLVQPGEHLFVIPKLAVEKGAVPKVESIVAQLDPNSHAGKKQNLRRDIGPKITFINLPDKVTATPPKSSGGLNPGKPQIPEFDVVMDSQKRIEVAEELGILDLV